MFRWLSGRGARQRDIALESARITDAIWRRTVRAHPFLVGLTPQDDAALRERAAWLLASKVFNGAQGFQLNDEIMLSIAIQAALPIMALSPILYEGWHEIVVYPGGFLIPRTDIDDSGIVHEYMMQASGEAWEGGPVILSWADAGPRQGEQAANVVIHEFAHKLDLQSGEADGIPGLHAHPQLSRRRWRQVLEASFEQFNLALDAVETAIPADVDPESPDAEQWYRALPLDPYAATDPAEFFAVSSEAFFIAPHAMARQLPAWYELLKRYYRQDPLERQLRSKFR